MDPEFEDTSMETKVNIRIKHCCAFGSLEIFTQMKSLLSLSRWMFPLLVRSYHSLVGWNVQDSLTGLDKEFANLTSLEGPAVCVFGGFTNGIDVFSGGELPLHKVFFIKLNMLVSN